MKSSVRPASGPPRASVSSTRTVVVPTASTRSAARIRSHAAALDLVALAVERCSSTTLDLQRPEGVEADVERDALDVEPRQQLRREVQPGGRRRGRPGLVRVHRLVALGIGERLGDVRRQRHLARRLAVQPHAPAALAEVLEQLDRPVVAGPPAAAASAARAPPTRRRRAARAAAPRRAARRSGSAPRSTRVSLTTASVPAASSAGRSRNRP